MPIRKKKSTKLNLGKYHKERLTPVIEEEEELPAMMEDLTVWHGSAGQAKEPARAEAAAAEQSGHSVAMDGPFFSSNLKYYPDLPQPPHEVPYGKCRNLMDSLERKQQQKRKRQEENEMRKMPQPLGQKTCQWTQPLETAAESQLSSRSLACHLKKNELDAGPGSNRGQHKKQQKPQKQGLTNCSYNAMPAIMVPAPRELPQPPTDWLKVGTGCESGSGSGSGCSYDGDSFSQGAKPEFKYYF